jgi:nucleoside-diphosphate-sugar epimerase
VGVRVGSETAVKTAIVTGASGFIGTHLVRRLIASGRYGLVHAIDIAPAREIVEGVRYHQLDVRQALPAAIGDGAAIIYNLAAVHRTPGHPPHEYYDTNVNGAISVTEFAEACGVPAIVFTSSISVYGPREELVTEDTAPAPTSDYGRSKLMAERVHQSWAETDGRKLVVVRPGVVFGPGERGNYTRLARALKGGWFAYPGRRDTIKSGGYVEELILAIDFALASNDREVIFNFAYPDRASTETIVETFAEILATNRRPPTLPAGALLGAAAAFELANSVGLRNSVHRDRVRKLMQSTLIEPEWLKANGYVFSTDLRSALEQWRDHTAGRFD